MEKLKITREQEEALKDFKKYGTGFKNFVERDFNYTNIFAPLNDFTPEQFALLLCGWYEVEQPFKVGDWVFNPNHFSYAKIKKIQKNVIDYRYTNENYDMEATPDSFNKKFEKVTEPWKIMLLELGRDKPEFEIEDIVMSEEGFIANFNGHEGSLGIKWAKENRIKYFYPVESRIEVKGNVSTE